MSLSKEFNRLEKEIAAMRAELRSIREEMWAGKSGEVEMAESEQQTDTHETYPYVSVCACGKEYWRGVVVDYTVNCECGRTWTVPASRGI